MDSYLKYNVPVYWNAEWFTHLRNNMEKAGIDVDWQKPGTFHITAVYIYDTGNAQDLCDAFERIISRQHTPSITIDKFGVFQAKISKHLVIHLDSTKKDDEVMPLINELRDAAKALGANIEDFRFHITLSKNVKTNTTPEQVQQILDTIPLPSFTLPITEVEYRWYNPTIRKWTLSN